VTKRGSRVPLSAERGMQCEPASLGQGLVT